MFPMYLVKQNFSSEHIDNVEAHVRDELNRMGVKEKVFPGMKVCLAYGSRGFPYGVRVICTLVETFKEWGAAPFIIPAMGSHGGGTDEGQLRVLEKNGVSEKELKVPVKSCVDATPIGRTAHGVPVYCDRHALEADGVFLFNRVKPHTGFRAPIESGLTKMMAVGMGKVRGAEAAHRFGLGSHLVEMADIIAENVNFLGGIASVDNFQGQAMVLKGVTAEQRKENERELLKLAWSQLPKVPFDHLHVLVVSEMGKNISGSGMDVNVIGMHRRLGGEAIQNYETLVVLDLTPESEGNALGVGYADITTRALVDKIDYRSTYKNALTTGFLSSVKIPCTLETKQEAVKTACEFHGLEGCRVAWIKDTKHLEYMWISPAVLEENENLEVLMQVSSIYDIEAENW